MAVCISAGIGRAPWQARRLMSDDDHRRGDDRLGADVQRDIWVLGLAIGVFGLSFGVLATTAGLSVAQACAMSVLVFTGASQFARWVLEAGGSVGSAFGRPCCSARNAAYGVALAPTMAGGRWAAPARRPARHRRVDRRGDGPVGTRAREQAFYATGLAVSCAGTRHVIGGVRGRHRRSQALGSTRLPRRFVALAVPHLRGGAGVWRHCPGP